MIETDRLVAGGAAANRETALDRAVRPQTLNDYIGQSAVREQMEIFLSMMQWIKYYLVYLMLNIQNPLKMVLCLNLTRVFL